MPELVNYTRLPLRATDRAQTYSGEDTASSVAEQFGSQGMDSRGLFVSPSRPGIGRSAVSSAVSTALDAIPFSDPRWCLHTGCIEDLTAVPGIRWAPTVRYVPIVVGYEATTAGIRARSVYELAAANVTADVIPSYDCGHCAYVAAEAHLAANPRASAPGYDPIYAGCLAFIESSSVQHMLPAGPESIGGTVTFNTDTVGLDPTLPNSCGTCGLLGHNARTCGRAGRAYAKVGIEIEGLWNNLRAVRNRAHEDGIGGCQDGSVHRNPDSNAEGYEFQTNPGTLREALGQLVSYYPDETNESCGMHVHVSFNVSTDATLLATQQFFDYFRARWIAWGQREHVWGYNAADPGGSRGVFWRRLFGGNDYCRVNRGTERNILTMDRYHQLNFSAWNEHRTVECRLLPMFKSARLGVSAVQELLSIFEDYLHDHADFPAVEVVMAPLALTPVVIDSHVNDPNTWLHDARYEVDAEEHPAQEAGTARVWAGLAGTLSVTEALAMIRA